MASKPTVINEGRVLVTTAVGNTTAVVSEVFECDAKSAGATIYALYNQNGALLIEVNMSAENADGTLADAGWQQLQAPTAIIANVMSVIKLIDMGLPPLRFTWTPSASPHTGSTRVVAYGR